LRDLVAGAGFVWRSPAPSHSEHGLGSVGDFPVPRVLVEERVLATAQPPFSEAVAAHPVLTGTATPVSYPLPCW